MSQTLPPSLFERNPKKTLFFFTLFLLLAVTGILCLVATATVRSLDPVVAAQKAGVEFDTRSRLEMVREARKEGRQAFPATLSTYFVGNPLRVGEDDYIPFGGVAGAETVLCNEAGRWVEFVSDRYGLNNPDEVWEDSRVDYVMTGDSFTYGQCVAPEEHFVSLLRQGKKIVNLGSGGSGPLLEYASLKEFTRDLEIGYVFNFYYEGNDLLNLEKEKQSPILRRYLADDGFSQEVMQNYGKLSPAIAGHVEGEMAKAKEEKTPEPGCPEKLQRAFFHLLPGIYALFQEMKQQAAPKQYDLSLFEEIMAKNKAYALEKHARFVFVYLPDYMGLAGVHSESGKKREEILAIMKKLEIPVIDMSQVFSAVPDYRSLFHYGLPTGHYNATGYRLLAEAINRYVASDR